MEALDFRAVIDAAARAAGHDPDELRAAAAASEPWYAEPGDFRDADGVLVCGTCAKPKETPDGFPIVHEHQLGALNRRRLTAEEEAERARVLRSRCFSGGFADLAERCTLDRLASDTDPAAAEALLRFVRDFGREYRRQGRGLLLHGPQGRGKTFMAAAACNALVDAGYRCLMTSLKDIRGRIEQKYGTEATELERLRRKDLVVLDDLFRERDTEWGRELSQTVVDELYRNRVSVVVTTNAGADSISLPRTAHAAFVLDRLKERCERVEVGGPNRRQGVIA